MEWNAYLFVWPRFTVMYTLLHDFDWTIKTLHQYSCPANFHFSLLFCNSGRTQSNISVWAQTTGLLRLTTTICLSTAILETIRYPIPNTVQLTWRNHKTCASVYFYLSFLSLIMLIKQCFMNNLKRSCCSRLLMVKSCCKSSVRLFSFKKRKHGAYAVYSVRYAWLKVTF